MSKYFVMVRPAANWHEDSGYVGPAFSAIRQLDGTMKYYGGFLHQILNPFTPTFNIREAWKAMNRLSRMGFMSRIEAAREGGSKEGGGSEN